MDLSHLDDETASLVLRLQSEDLEALAASEKKGKHHEGTTPDSYVAAREFQAELEAVKGSVADRLMAKGIAFAVIHDAEAIQEVTALENQAAQDRRVALGSRDAINNQDNGTKTDALDEEYLQKLEAIYVWNGDDTDSLFGQPESSKWAASRKAAAFENRSDCTACGDNFPFFDMIRGPCRHEYCKGCMKDLFESSFTDESLFPPRCCKRPIPANKQIVLLGPQLVQTFLSKKVEFETKSRTYCHVPTCSSFVPPSSIHKGVATCPQCTSKTCVECKARFHEGKCFKDPRIQAVLELATKNGWQRCKEYNRVVELTQGCYHITCPCRSEFYYLCGMRWKTCQCRHWDEARLMHRAQEYANRPQNRGLDANQRAILVDRERQNLIRNHNCLHESWDFRRGMQQCNECHEVMPVFSFECCQCHIMACRRCMRNRL